jgi:hypothetical protein
MNRVELSDRSSSAPAAISRRSATLGLGGGGLALLLASGVLPGTAHAQDASPVAGMAEGKAFLAIRQYELASGRTMEELTALVESGFIPILKEVPGYQEYILLDTGAGVISISIFADQAGAEESTARAADWVGENLAGMFSGPPVVTTGSVWLHDMGASMSGTPTP